MSFLAALAWLAGDLIMTRSYSNTFVPYINETFRLTVFLIVTCVVWKLKNVLDHEKEFARTDVLTGIPNRRAFFELAANEINRSRRHKTPFTIF